MQFRDMLALALGLSISSPALAGQSLPIISGRWSADNCAKQNGAASRYFSAGSTSTSNSRCSIVIKNKDGIVYTVHLACAYKQANDGDDDAVIEVKSPMSLKWVNECMAIQYHFCSK